MNEHPPLAAAETLPALFAEQVGDPVLAATLHARLEEFARAVAAGGSREEYRRWEASRNVLLAAIEILDT